MSESDVRIELSLSAPLRMEAPKPAPPVTPHVCCCEEQHLSCQHWAEQYIEYHARQGMESES